MRARSAIGARLLGGRSRRGRTSRRRARHRLACGARDSPARARLADGPRLVRLASVDAARLRPGGSAVRRPGSRTRAATIRGPRDRSACSVERRDRRDPASECARAVGTTLHARRGPIVPRRRDAAKCRCERPVFSLDDASRRSRAPRSARAAGEGSAGSQAASGEAQEDVRARARAGAARRSGALGACKSQATLDRPRAGGRAAPPRRPRAAGDARRSHGRFVTRAVAVARGLARDAPARRAARPPRASVARRSTTPPRRRAAPPRRAPIVRPRRRRAAAASPKRSACSRRRRPAPSDGDARAGARRRGSPRERRASADPCRSRRARTSVAQRRRPRARTIGGETRSRVAARARSPASAPRPASSPERVRLADVSASRARQARVPLIAVPHFGGIAAASARSRGVASGAARPRRRARQRAASERVRMARAYLARSRGEGRRRPAWSSSAVARARVDGASRASPRAHAAAAGRSAGAASDGRTDGRARDARARRPHAGRRRPALPSRARARFGCRRLAEPRAVAARRLRARRARRRRRRGAGARPRACRRDRRARSREARMATAASARARRAIRRARRGAREPPRVAEHRASRRRRASAANERGTAARRAAAALGIARRRGACAAWSTGWCRADPAKAARGVRPQRRGVGARARARATGDNVGGEARAREVCARARRAADPRNTRRPRAVRRARGAWLRAAASRDTRPSARRRASAAPSAAHARRSVAASAAAPTARAPGDRRREGCAPRATNVARPGAPRRVDRRAACRAIVPGVTPKSPHAPLARPSTRTMRYRAPRVVAAARRGRDRRRRGRRGASCASAASRGAPATPLRRAFGMATAARYPRRSSRGAERALRVVPARAGAGVAAHVSFSAAPRRPPSSARARKGSRPAARASARRATAQARAARARGRRVGGATLARDRGRTVVEAPWTGSRARRGAARIDARIARPRRAAGLRRDRPPRPRRRRRTTFRARAPLVDAAAIARRPRSPSASARGAMTAEGVARAPPETHARGVARCGGRHRAPRRLRGRSRRARAALGERGGGGARRGALVGGRRASPKRPRSAARAPRARRRVAPSSPTRRGTDASRTRGVDRCWAAVAKLGAPASSPAAARSRRRVAIGAPDAPANRLRERRRRVVGARRGARSRARRVDELRASIDEASAALAGGGRRLLLLRRSLRARATLAPSRATTSRALARLRRRRRTRQRRTRPSFRAISRPRAPRRARAPRAPRRSARERRRRRARARLEHARSLPSPTRGPRSSRARWLRRDAARRPSRGAPLGDAAKHTSPSSPRRLRGSRARTAAEREFRARGSAIGLRLGARRSSPVAAKPRSRLRARASASDPRCARQDDCDFSSASARAREPLLRLRELRSQALVVATRDDVARARARLRRLGEGWPHASSPLRELFLHRDGRRWRRRVRAAAPPLRLRRASPKAARLPVISDARLGRGRRVLAFAASFCGRRGNRRSNARERERSATAEQRAFALAARRRGFASSGRGGGGRDSFSAAPQASAPAARAGAAAPSFALRRDARGQRRPPPPPRSSSLLIRAAAAASGAVVRSSGVGRWIRERSFARGTCAFVDATSPRALGAVTLGDERPALAGVGAGGAPLLYGGGDLVRITPALPAPSRAWPPTSVVDARRGRLCRFADGRRRGAPGLVRRRDGSAGVDELGGAREFDGIAGAPQRARAVLARLGRDSQRRCNATPRQAAPSPAPRPSRLRAARRCAAPLLAFFFEQRLRARRGAPRPRSAFARRADSGRRSSRILPRAAPARSCRSLTRAPRLLLVRIRARLRAPRSCAVGEYIQELGAAPAAVVARELVTAALSAGCRTRARPATAARSSPPGRRGGDHRPRRSSPRRGPRRARPHEPRARGALDGASLSVARADCGPTHGGASVTRASASTPVRTTASPRGRRRVSARALVGGSTPRGGGRRASRRLERRTRSRGGARRSRGRKARMRRSPRWRADLRQPRAAGGAPPRRRAGASVAVELATRLFASRGGVVDARDARQRGLGGRRSSARIIAPRALCSSPVTGDDLREAWLTRRPAGFDTVTRLDPERDGGRRAVRTSRRGGRGEGRGGGGIDAPRRAVALRARLTYLTIEP